MVEKNINISDTRLEETKEKTSKNIKLQKVLEYIRERSEGQKTNHSRIKSQSRITRTKKN